MRILRSAALLLLVCGCTRSSQKDVGLASQARTHLAERERKLSSYRFHGVSTDVARNETLAFDFAYKNPNKMRGETFGATPHVLAFDGRTFRDLDVNAKKLTTYDLSGLSKPRADVFLHQVFAAFVPEGFRAPLLPAGRPLEAVESNGPDGRREVALSATIPDGDAKYAFSFRFATPAMDLIEKKVSGPEGESRVQVIKQTCDHATGLCFPTEILESHGGKPTVRTVLSDIAINGPVTDAELVPAVPDGGSEEKKSLAAAAP